MKYLANCSVENFSALLSACAHDPHFPREEARWQQFVDDDTRSEGALGELPPQLEIDVDDFQHWCWSVAVQPGLDVLISYVIVLRHQLSQRIGGFDEITRPPGARDGSSTANGGDSCAAGARQLRGHLQSCRNVGTLAG